MDSQKATKIKYACSYCNKNFFNSSSKNRHIRTIHKQSLEATRKKHIYCPVCKEKVSFLNYNNLNKHLGEIHQINMEEQSFTLSSKEESNQWMRAARIDVNYATSRTLQYKDYTESYYYCNRTNTKGYTSQWHKRTEKSGGSIKISRTCPARVIIKLYENGKTTIKYFKTHVGHEEEIRTQHLSKTEKEMIVEKLKMGVTVDRILKDAKTLECDEVKRINMLNRKDVSYLAKKYNIDMLACAEEKTSSHDKESKQFIEEHGGLERSNVDREAYRNNGIERVRNFLLGLDDEAYERFMKDFGVIVNKEENKK